MSYGEEVESVYFLVAFDDVLGEVSVVAAEALDGVFMHLGGDVVGAFDEVFDWEGAGGEEALEGDVFGCFFYDLEAYEAADHALDAFPFLCGDLGGRFDLDDVVAEEVLLDDLGFDAFAEGDLGFLEAVVGFAGFNDEAATLHLCDSNGLIVAEFLG